ncbi:MAG: GntP family permease [Bacteroidales bacterium]|jgi:gluconate:H+ symporter, GntP family|nr:GntP family permease [Bacteroidales bacterium]MCI1733805.1 GntP family permease [Bacteroidales bacterium]
MLIVISFVAAIVLLIISISKWKIHPFLALMGISLLLAIVLKLPLDAIPDIIGKGFASTFTGIGIVIILGMLIGSILEASGAAIKLADVVVKTVGKKHPELAMLIMGFIVSIPVFCDSGFVIMNPIRKAMSRKTGVSPVSMAVALAAGLYCSHVFIPPTPGPIAAAGFLGVENNLLGIIGLGTLISIPCLVVAYFYARYIGKKTHSSEESVVASAIDNTVNYNDLPSGWAAFAPIIIPIVFMAAGSVASLIGIDANSAGGGGFLYKLLVFLGKPIIALTAGLLFALVLLPYIKMRGGSFRTITEDSLKTAGPILFITAAGGVLGGVITSAGFVELIKSHASAISSIGILFPFIIAAILKTAQGSSTVAITTTAGIMGMYSSGSSMMAALGLTSPLAAVLTVLAIGAGGMTVSHANDSYFWVVTSFSGQDTKTGYKTQTVSTLLLGLTAIATIVILKSVLL